MKQTPKVTLQYIAEQLGLSVTTVSRALSGQARRYRIGRQTELKVRQLARTIGFTPNQLARGLRLQKTSSIGLVIPDISNPYFANIARQITLGARQRNYSVIVFDSQDIEELEIESLELLRGRGVEGIVLCPVGRSANHLAGFETNSPPVVLVDRYFPGLRLPYVVSDNYGGAKEAVSYLIQHGHSRIACIQGLHGTSPNEDRLRGYKDALSSHGLPVDELIIAGDDFGLQNGYVATKLLLGSARTFTAIFALSNLISLGVIRALSESGLRIPEDISIIAFDDQPYSAYLAAPMTVVSQPSVEMGQIALKLLFDRLQSTGSEPPGGIVLPTTLVVRGSVRDMKAVNNLGERIHVCG